MTPCQGLNNIPYVETLVPYTMGTITIDKQTQICLQVQLDFYVPLTAYTTFILAKSFSLSYLMYDKHSSGFTIYDC